MTRIAILLIIQFITIKAICQSSTMLPNAVEAPKLAVLPTCDANGKGQQIFNTTDNKMYFCNGTVWTDMTGGGLSLPYSGNYSAGGGNGIDAFIVINNSINTAFKPNAIVGINNVGGIGVKGESNTGYGLYGSSMTSIGVIGESNSGRGLVGLSTSSYGIYGSSSSSYAGYFDGMTRIASYLHVDDRIGINTTPSNVSLHIKGQNDGTWNQGIKLESPVSTDYSGILYDNDGLKFRVFDANDQYYFRNSANNNLARINATGDLSIAGTLTQNSDSRLKRNIQPVNSSLTNLKKLKGYNYYWKTAKTDNDLQTGLIAQEVQAIFPELVANDEDGMLSVNYMGLIPHLVEAVKDLAEKTKKIEDLEARLAKIEKLLK